MFGSSDTKSTKNKNNNDYRLTKKELKRLRKERDRAEMEAYEDMLVYLEAFSDDWELGW